MIPTTISSSIRVNPEELPPRRTGAHIATAEV
jgi:hypothetical protein